MGHIEKKPFDQKWTNATGKWVGKWQTKGKESIPDDLPPYMESMRIWAFEMSEWAKQVTDDWDEVNQLSGRVTQLDQRLHEMDEVLRKLKNDVARLKPPKKRPT